jgi:hypothetical protein
MNPKSVVIWVVSAGVLILLAVLLGRYTIGQMGSEPTSPEPQPPTRTARQRPVVADDAPMVCVSGRRDPDRFFLVIQELRGNGDADKTEAERIIGFCKSQNLPADMVELQHGDRSRVAVWCLLGYRFKNSQSALDHVRKVEDVGEAYFRAYNTYHFKQRRKSDGTLWPVFYSGKLERPAE